MTNMNIEEGSMVTVLQMKDGGGLRGMRFFPYADLERAPAPDDYEAAFSFTLGKETTAEGLFQLFSGGRLPDGWTGRPMAVSDVIAWCAPDGERKACYVDSMGFTGLSPDFAAQTNAFFTEDSLEDLLEAAGASLKEGALPAIRDGFAEGGNLFAVGVSGGEAFAAPAIGFGAAFADRIAESDAAFFADVHHADGDGTWGTFFLADPVLLGQKLAEISGLSEGAGADRLFGWLGSFPQGRKTDIGRARA